MEEYEMYRIGALVLVLLAIGGLIIWQGAVYEENQASTFCMAYGKVSPAACMDNYKYYKELNASNHSKYDINETKDNSTGE